MASTHNVKDKKLSKFQCTLEILTQTSQLFANCPDVTDELFMWVLITMDWKKILSVFLFRWILVFPAPE